MIVIEHVKHDRYFIKIDLPGFGKKSFISDSKEDLFFFLLHNVVGWKVSDVKKLKKFKNSNRQFSLFNPPRLKSEQNNKENSNARTTTNTKREETKPK